MKAVLNQCIDDTYLIYDATLDKFSNYLKKKLREERGFKLYKYVYVEPKDKNSCQYKFNKIFAKDNGRQNDIFEGIGYLQTEDVDVVRTIWNEYVGMSKLCSISEDPNNNLMWAHYAKNHKGICIEYDMGKAAINDVNILGCLYPVIYTDKRVMPLYFEDVACDIYPYDKRDTKGLFLFKQEIWKYEREWRFILEDIECEDIDFPYATAVYIGFNCDERDKEAIKTACVNEKIDCYQMVMNSEDYVLNSVKINL